MNAYQLHKLYSIIGKMIKHKYVFPLIIQTKVKKSSCVFNTPPYRSLCHPSLDRLFFQSNPRFSFLLLRLRRTSPRTFISMGANVNPKLDLSLSTPLLEHLLVLLAVSLALNNTSARAQESVVSVANTALLDTGVDQNRTNP